MSVKQPQPATAVQALGLLRHRFMATRVASIMLIALLASCGGGGGGSADAGNPPSGGGATQADYFPLTLGSRWSYSSQASSTHYRVTASAVSNGRTTATMASLDGDTLSSTVYERVGNDIVAVPQPSDGPLAMALGPLTLLKLPLVAGASYVATDRTQPAALDVDGDGRADDVGVKIEVQVLGFEPLTTPAGSFERVAQVRTTFTLRFSQGGSRQSVTSTSVQDDFYAPDIGLVRSVEHANAEARTPEVVRTLSAYAVGGRRSESKAPLITSREPAPDTAVQLNAQFIGVYFDEPMDRLGPTPQFRLTHANGQDVPVQVYWGNDRILTGFIPGMLTTGAHRLQLLGELEDLAANPASGFREWTVLIDREGPSVVTSSPAAGATGVSTTAPITVTLNEAAVLPDPGSPLVTLSVLGRDVPVDVSQSGSTLRLSPRGPLHHGARYTVAVRTLADNLGNVSEPSVNFSATWSTDNGRFMPLKKPEPALPLAHSAQLVTLDATGRRELWIARGHGGFARQLSAVSFMPDGSWGPSRLLQESTCSLEEFAAGDVNGDGRPDAVVVTGCGAHVLTPSTDGGFATVSLATSGERRDYMPRIVRRAGQTAQGFVTARRTGLQVNQLLLWQSSSPSTFQSTMLNTGLSVLHQVEVFDINADGRDDVVVMGQPESSSALALVALLQAADGSFGAPTGVLARWCGLFGGFSHGDLNGDGRQDLLLRGDTCTQPGLLSLLQTASGSFEGSLAPIPAADVGEVKLVDVDGDGRLDLVTLEDGATVFRYRLQRGDGRFAEAVTHVASGEDWRSQLLLVADLDGDGRVDVLTGEGAHIQLRVSPSAVAPGVRALGRLPGLHKGVRGAAPRGSAESQEPPQGL